MRWTERSHVTPGADFVPPDKAAPLRTPRAAGRPLWMADDEAVVDPRLADCLVFDPQKDSLTRHATHWTVRDQARGCAARSGCARRRGGNGLPHRERPPRAQGDGDQSRGDGGA